MEKQKGLVDIFVRYCTCGGILELYSPLNSTAELSALWDKAHPENLGHKRLTVRREAEVQGREWRRKLRTEQRRMQKELEKNGGGAGGNTYSSPNHRRVS